MICIFVYLNLYLYCNKCYSDTIKLKTKLFSPYYLKETIGCSENTLGFHWHKVKYLVLLAFNNMKTKVVRIKCRCTLKIRFDNPSSKWQIEL